MTNYIWSYEGQNYWWRDYEFKILYSYLFRFEKKNNIEFIEVRKIDIEGDMLLSLKHFIDLLIFDLISDCYIAPTHKQLSKNGSSYEKIIVNEVSYHINYRINDQVGSAIFAFYEFARYLDLAINEKGIITINTIKLQ